MNSEFNWWLLIVGLVIGGGLAWLILADGARREADVRPSERASEARWITEQLRQAGGLLDDSEVEDVLELHQAYLSFPPPDVPGRPVEEPQPSETPVDETSTGASEPPRMAHPTAAPPPAARSDGDGLPV